LRFFKFKKFQQQYFSRETSSVMSISSRSSRSSTSTISSRRAPSRISEYLDTSRLELARTKMGTIMIYDKDGTMPIDDRGWVRKKDACVGTGPVTKVKAYLDNDLPLLGTPRSDGTDLFAGGGVGSLRPRVRIPNEFAPRTNGPLLRKPATFEVDFHMAMKKLSERKSDFEKEVQDKLAQVARDQRLESFERDEEEAASGNQMETDSNASVRSVKSSKSNKSSKSSKSKKRRKSASKPPSVIENPEEMNADSANDEQESEIEDDGDSEKSDGSGDGGDDDGSESENEDEKNVKKLQRPPNARSDWTHNSRHEKMAARMSRRQHAGRGEGCGHNHARRTTRSLSRRSSKSQNENNRIVALPDLTAARKAFDVKEYQHSCPVTVYKNRMARRGY